MANNFKEFLEKNVRISIDGLKPIDWSKVKKGEDWTKGCGQIKTIFVKDLGEFIKSEIEHLEKENFDTELKDGIDLAYTEGVIQYLKEWLRDLK